MNDQNDNLLGRAVASRRSALGLKRRDLADRANLSYPYISEIENGLKEPSAKAQRQIAEALELTVAELAALAEAVGATPGMAPPPPVATRAPQAPEATLSAARPARSSATRAPAAPASLRYASLASSGAIPEDVRALVLRELDRFAAEELPSLIRAEVRRVLAEPAEEDPQ